MSENNANARGGFMTKLATFIVDKRNLFFLFTIIALIFSAFSRNWVQVESDLAAYLPEDSQTRQTLDIMEEQFTTYGSAQIMAANLSQDQAEELKDQIAGVKGVQGVEYGNTTDHYNNASALYAVTFDYDEADEECLTSLAAIESALSSYDIYVSTEPGNAEQEAIDSEVSVIMVYVAVIIVLVLLFTSQTYAEVPVLILTFVAAMIMNLGTNFLLGKISFVSNSVTSILQLALSLDYAVIFCNRYKEEHQTLPIREAVIVALSKAIPEIGASSLTTIGGLVAMMFMQFRIGADMAICLIKSILFAALAFADETGDDAIHIQTQEDLRALAENCRLDTWSQGKTVVLDKDIALDEDAAEFLPIPTFGGTFEGGGHTISGLSLTGEDSNAGLFDTLQESALVRRLTVAGQVTPGGAADTIGGIAGTNYGRLVDCSFEGAVKGDDSVGGIVGINETTGQLINCRFQGTVTGEHYVGGIAGLARVTIRNCYVKCSLSGNDYVGGVAGASEENTVVSGCCSLVEIAEDGRYTGAVCGTETGEFTGNFYVSDTLAGLGRISYAGKAEPITFETLVQTDGIPDRMTRFTRRFLAEGEEIKSYEFSYGASFG